MFLTFRGETQSNDAKWKKGVFSATSGHWLGSQKWRTCFGEAGLTNKVNQGFYPAGYFARVLDPPPRSTWSMAMGPAPKKIKAKARVAAARGNSNP